MTTERQKQWNDLRDEVNAKGGNGEDFVAAMQELYSLYDDRCIEWFASLYDHNIGGFYFARSAIDADGYLPDIEATHCCLAFFERFEGVENYRDVMPDWLKVSIGKWVKGLQDPNGYFYHPQWTHELVDSKLSRKGRDLSYGLGTLHNCGFTPTYDTPYGQKGDGLLPDGTPVCQMKKEEAVADGKTKAPASVEYPEHLISVESFKKYLLDNTERLKTTPYSMGNQISNQVAQIITRDRQLRAEGAEESICELLIEWFYKHQNPETGNWYHYKEGDGVKTVAFEGNNSLLKIIDSLNQLGAELPHPIEAARSAMQILRGDEAATSVCDMYNTWYAIEQVILNIEKHSKLSEEEKKAYVHTIRSELLSDAPDCIRGMRKKLEPFKRPDGAFSYCTWGTSITSQGVPCALPGFDESDTNASSIVIGGCNNHVYKALGLTAIKPFESEQLKRYISLLEARRNG